MKLRCIKRYDIGLTLDKVYYGTICTHSSFLIFNDFEKWEKYDFDRFEPADYNIDVNGNRFNKPIRVDHYVASTPPGFSDAKCCLHCKHSERIDINSHFLNCPKYKTTCEDTTICKKYIHQEEECEDEYYNEDSQKEIDDLQLGDLTDKDISSKSSLRSHGIDYTTDGLKLDEKSLQDIPNLNENFFKKLHRAWKKT